MTRGRGRRTRSGDTRTDSVRRAGRRVGAANPVALLGLALALGAGCASPSLDVDRPLPTVDPIHSSEFAAGPPERVFLISVAGLVPANYLDAYGHAAADGVRVHMPNLARWAREGAAGLAAIPPVPSAARSTAATLVTGRRPPSHGIVADATLDEEGTRALPFDDSRLIAGGTLWDAAIARGVVSLGWPTTGAARIERLLPEAGALGLGFDRPGTSPTLRREIEAIRSEGRGKAESAPPTPAEEDGVLVEVACRFVRSERDAGLILMRLDQAVGPLVNAGPGSLASDAALARVDAELGRLIGCLTEAGQLDSTALFVVGDVAYHPVHTQVAPNTALVRTGLIGRDPRATTGVRSWLALARSQGHSAYVYARDAANALDARRVLEEEADRTRAFSLVPAKALAAMDGDPNAWFALVAAPGFVLSDALVGPALSPSEARGAAGLLPTDARAEAAGAVGFVAWGRGVRESVRLPRVELQDVAPTIAALLGIRLETPPAGRVMLGILRAAVPPPPPGPRRLGTDWDADERLRDLRRDRNGGGR